MISTILRNHPALCLISPDRTCAPILAHPAMVPSERMLWVAGEEACAVLKDVAAFNRFALPDDPAAIPTVPAEVPGRGDDAIGPVASVFLVGIGR